MNTNDTNQILTNLASPKIGTKVIEVSDDFFGAASRMLNDKEPVFIEDKYDENGKWMDARVSEKKLIDVWRTLADNRQHLANV